MNTNQRILVFAPGQETLGYLCYEQTIRGYCVEWWPAENWHPGIFENVSLIVLDLVDWEFEHRECVRALRAHLSEQEDRPFPVVMLVRPDAFNMCTCGKNLCRTVLHQTHAHLDMDDLAAIARSTSNLSSLLFELSSSSNAGNWKKAERILLLLAIHGIRIPGCDEALSGLRQHLHELGHDLRVDICEGALVHDSCV